MQNLAYMKQGDNIFFYFLYAAVGMEHVILLFARL